MAEKIVSSLGPDVEQSHATAGQLQVRNRRSIAAVVVVLLLIMFDNARLRKELGFFAAGSLYSASGTAPVPQDDPLNPALDSALRGIATALPRNAVCVIALDAWRGDYFRASYLLMPRRVWPAVQAPTTAILRSGVLLQALDRYHADCLLIPSGQPAPGTMHLVRSGSIALYLRSSGSIVR